jgi:hypothetical protein
VGPTSAQLIPVSPVTQSETDATIRTAPVVELTQALTFVDAGAAIAAAPTKSENTQIARALRADIYFLLCMVESGGAHRH